jgi:hypothetical protein
MTAGDAYRTALVLADHNLNSDSATHADFDAASDLAGAPRPDADDRAVVRLALDALAD